MDIEVFQDFKCLKEYLFILRHTSGYSFETFKNIYIECLKIENVSNFTTDTRLGDMVIEYWELMYYLLFDNSGNIKNYENCKEDMKYMFFVFPRICKMDRKKLFTVERKAITKKNKIICF